MSSRRSGIRNRPTREVATFVTRSADSPMLLGRCGARVENNLEHMWETLDTSCAGRLQTSVRPTLACASVLVEVSLWDSKCDCCDAAT
jgi:hypothetical protein